MDQSPNNLSPVPVKSSKTIVIVVTLVIILVAAGYAVRFLPTHPHAETPTTASDQTIPNLAAANGLHTFTTQNADGTTNTVSADVSNKVLPAGFPSTFPIMGGFVLQTGAALSGAQIPQGAVGTEWTSHDKTQAIFDYYTNALPQNGFSVISHQVDTNSMLILFSNTADSSKGGFLTAMVQPDGSTKVDFLYGSNLSAPPSGN